MVFGSKSRKERISAPKSVRTDVPMEEAPEETETPVREAPEHKTPPVFIKVDKYKDIIKNIQELKSYALGLRDALDALTDIERELKSGLELTNKALDRFNTIISLLDAKLLKFGEGEDMTRVPGEMDEYVKNLYNQVENIRHELRTIESESDS